MSASFDLVLVGTGFASTFFLLEYLRHASPDARVLVLERGKRYTQAWRTQFRSNTEINFDHLLDNKTPHKQWVQALAFGGGTCWSGNTPRPHPSDFRLHRLHGIGSDWPLDYEELEPYFSEVEDLMGISGAAGGPYPRSRPYPLPPHHLNAFDRLLAGRYPGEYLPMPSARASRPLEGRGQCCANGICSHCPVLAKFQIDPHLESVYRDPRVDLRIESRVDRVVTGASNVQGVIYDSGGKEQRANGEVVAIGAHAVMTPFLLLRSGFRDAALGRYLNEQAGLDVQVDLEGVDNFDGSQAVTGLGTMFLDRPTRSHVAGCLVEGWNVPELRADFGKWRQRAKLKFIFEEIPSENSRVTATEDSDRPTVSFAGFSDYHKRGVASVPQLVEELIAGLPVERYTPLATSGHGVQHVQGTTRMGDDPATSVVDRTLRHHRYRNLLLLGSGTFPSCPAANPTMPLSALSLHAARQLMASSV